MNFGLLTFVGSSILRSDDVTAAIILSPAVAVSTAMPSTLGLMTGADPCRTIWASFPGEMTGAVVSVTIAASLSLSKAPTILPS